MSPITYCDKLSWPTYDFYTTQKKSPKFNGENWYRFMPPAGTHLVVGTPQKNSCGTQATGWMKGKNPMQKGETVNRTACFYWDDNTCKVQTEIKVRNCDSYYLYYLPETPICQLRYCAQ